jgi:two-component system, LuxR family, sensor kinase FixL
LKILIIDRLSKAPGLVRKLQSDQQVVSNEDDLEHIEMVLFISLDVSNEVALIASLSNRMDCVRLAHAELMDHAEVWQVIKDVIDDLFHSTKELISRLPFIHGRLLIRESRRKMFKAVFESTVEGIIIIDVKGVVQLFNSAAESIFQYSSAEIFGKNVSVLMPGMYAKNHDQYINNYVSTGKRKIIGIGREVTGLRKSGAVFPMELAVSEFESDGRRLFVGTVRDVSERRKLEHEVLRISEQERRRVGQDLHDGLGQMLTGISLIGVNLAKRLEEKKSEFAEDMYEIADLVREADRMTRNIARGLVQVELEGDGMSAALRTLCANAEKYFSVSCTYQEYGKIVISDSIAASNLYRIAQEAVSNAAKHGRAENIVVTLQSTSGSLILTIEDDGIGFPEVLKADRGMGVDIMGYRARVITALLEIEAEEGRGTIVRCTLSSPQYLN